METEELTGAIESVCELDDASAKAFDINLMILKLEYDRLILT